MKLRLLLVIGSIIFSQAQAADSVVQGTQDRFEAIVRTEQIIQDLRAGKDVPENRLKSIRDDVISLFASTGTLTEARIAISTLQRRLNAGGLLRKDIRASSLLKHTFDALITGLNENKNSNKTEVAAFKKSQERIINAAYNSQPLVDDNVDPKIKTKGASKGTIGDLTGQERSGIRYNDSEIAD